MAKDIITRLKDPVILIATLANLVPILVLLNIIGDVQADEITKILASVGYIIVQSGILKKPKIKVKNK